VDVQFGEEEFGWLGGWGFNFARLPMDYRHFMDSDRTDVDYEEFHGHRLDRRMLELLQKYATPQANVLLTPARRPCYLWHHESAPACGFRRTGVRTAWKAVSVA
jgi:hypothetical protein